ncbi:phospholipid-transporting ATPase IF-like [Cydia fagiglandana]|uniref:phospholipid-transporting ATPase IF-like n=1 Tax=Cydia fagiglandana TaxID=1458189 RepID=UPI002FEE5F63
MEAKSVFNWLPSWFLWFRTIFGCRFFYFIVQAKKEDGTAKTRLIEVGATTPGKRHNEIKTSRYTLLTFVPKNLAEQFRRVIHVYFVIVTIISLAIDSPVSPLTSIVPLAFMVMVTAIKSAHEDWRRHGNDGRVNNQMVEVLQEGKIKEVRNSAISPGTLVRVKEGSEVPADLVLLCSEGVKGKCFVTTANLDGDTNLKTLRVPLPLVGCTPENLPQGLRIEIPNPIADLYTFFGRLIIPGTESLPLSTDKLMMRGSRVLNTEWALGCAVYTGEETKLALNAKYVSNKFSSCESATNRCLFVFIGIIILQIAVSYIAKRYIDVNQQSRDLYLGLGATFPQPFSGVMQDVFSFLLLYYYIIPMSLFVTIEIYKFIGALYIGWDEDLRCKETGLRALANTSDLNQELGQIEILFSDKTGTLTKNIMAFKVCSIKGNVYEERKKLLYDISTEELVDTGQADIKLFFLILALCHTAQTSTADMRKLSEWLSGSSKQEPKNQIKYVKNGTIPNGHGFLHKSSRGMMNNIYKTNVQYQATSPDEKALVEAAARFGVTFLGEEGNNVFVKTKEDTEVYEKLESVEFTSERNRISVLFRDKNGKIWLFCKGAESSVFPLCRNKEMVDKINHDINAFAIKGLRTLAVAFREIHEEDYQEIRESIKKQTENSIEELEQITQQFRILERDLILLGATAVEDSLQDDVVETIASLRSAGIKFWMLTGDKVETTLNVAQSCAYISENTKQMFILGAKEESDIKAHLEECKRIADEGQSLALVVDGANINQILEKSVEADFVEVAMNCNAVLCCRMSPIQKAEIVKLIRNSPGRPITAAVGDGANDISMIQAAHVGFGIFGKEGHQAARSADYAFAKFSMLKRILLVMGHWYYQRFATLIHYSFYKNLVLGNLMLFYQMNCAFSTQSIYDSMYLTIYNLFTALPCMVLSVTEQRWPADLLLKSPMLYKSISKNSLMSWSRFSGWMLAAVYHSVVIYVAAALAVGDTAISADMKPVDLWSFGAVLYHLLVLIVNLKLWLQARYHTVAFAASVVFSVLVYVACNTLYASINVNLHGSILGTYIRLLASVTFWALNCLVVVSTLAPDYLYRYLSDRNGKRFESNSMENV